MERAGFLEKAGTLCTPMGQFIETFQENQVFSSSISFLNIASDRISFTQPR